MSKLEEIRKALMDRRVDRVSEATGVAYNTILKIKNDPEANPRWSTMQALSRYLGV